MTSANTLIADQRGKKLPVVPRPPHVITKDNLVDKLLFCFFGHDNDLFPHIKNASVRTQSKEKLIEILGLVYEAIINKQFPRQNYRWINDEVIEAHFLGRKFNQYNRSIRAEDIDFYNKKAESLRKVFAAIAAVSRVVHSDNVNVKDAWVLRLRAIAKINHNNRDVSRDQRELLGQIESSMLSVVVTPNQSITFNTDGNLVLKTKDDRFFVPKNEISRIANWLSGRYILYRKTFSNDNKEREFIKEYLVIDSSPLGPVFRWETRSPNGQADRTVLKGAIVFTDGVIWLICNTDKPFKRLRILSSDASEWYAHCQKQRVGTFFTGLILSQRQVEQRYEPVYRRAILVRELSDDWKNVDDEEKRTTEMSRDELVKVIPEDQFAIIDVT